jgi:hypothetical protein
MLLYDKNKNNDLHYFYFCKLSSFVCLFMYNSRKDIIKNFKDLLIINTKTNKIKNKFKFIFNFIFISKYSLLFDNTGVLSDYCIFKYGIIHFTKFFKFSNKMINYESKLNETFLNSVKDRSFIKPISNLLGFKIRSVGRFKRKQRATSFSILRGTVPLSTVKANIDYGYYSLPLKNSTITVKV